MNRLTDIQKQQTIAAFDCLIHGGEVEYLHPNGVWVTTDSVTTRFPHRPKPKPSMRPWSKPEDVPGPVCWIRPVKQTSLHMMVTTVWIAGIRFSDATGQVPHELHFGHDLEKWGRHEYSTDRKTWQKCEVPA